MGRRRVEYKNARADRELEELKGILTVYPFEWKSEEWVNEQARELLGESYPGWSVRADMWITDQLRLHYHNGARVRRHHVLNLTPRW